MEFIIVVRHANLIAFVFLRSGQHDPRRCLCQRPSHKFPVHTRCRLESSALMIGPVLSLTQRGALCRCEGNFWVSILLNNSKARLTVPSSPTSVLRNHKAVTLADRHGPSMSKFVVKAVKGELPSLVMI